MSTDSMTFLMWLMNLNVFNNPVNEIVAFRLMKCASLCDFDLFISFKIYLEPVSL